MLTQLIMAISKAVGVPGVLLLAICTHESGLKNIVTPDDNGSPSYGICQIKMDTAASLGYQGNKDSLMIPKINIRYAAKYLKMQLERYDDSWCKATAAYNSGTYNPSKAIPGKPRNLKYVNRIILLLDDKYKDYLICGGRKIATK